VVAGWSHTIRSCTHNSMQPNVVHSEHVTAAAVHMLLAGRGTHHAGRRRLTPHTPAPIAGLAWEHTYVVPFAARHMVVPALVGRVCCCVAVECVWAGYSRRNVWPCWWTWRT
jgi:hypothetical protein